MTAPAPLIDSTARTRFIALQVIYGVFLPVWFLLAVGLTIGLADLESGYGGLAILVVWAYPVVWLVTALVSRQLLRQPRPTVGWWVALVPMCWPLAGVALLTWAFWS